jgi:hypothetical protein
MNKKGIEFSGSFEIRVELSLESFERELQATLKIRENKLPVLSISFSSFIECLNLNLSEHEHKEIKCRSKIKSYTLIDNQVHGSQIWPTYIIEGEIDETYSGIEICISGFSEWLDQSSHFEITDSEIRKEFPKNKFDESVIINKIRYQIKSNYCCNIEKIENRDFLVSEYTTIQCIKSNGVIEPKETEELSHDIRQLFSLLTALPLSIEYVWFIDKEGEGRKAFYFCAPAGRKLFDSPHEALIHPSLIFGNESWGKIFNNYFSQNNFKKIWYRLPSLFSYEGIWDYEFLGYVSVLDSYCQKYAYKSGRKLKNEDYHKLKKRLITVLDDYSAEIGSDYDNVMKSFRTGIEGIKNTELPTFTEKFEFMMKRVDVGFRKVINFSLDEFKTIKRIRNSAAHGQQIDTQDDKDISFEYRIMDKLRILLMYLVHRDFGFSEIDFSKSIMKSLMFNKFIRNAEINRMERDRLSGIVPFYSVDEDSFRSASDTNCFSFGLKYFRSVDIYKFSHSVTKESQDWLVTINKKNRNLIDHIRECFMDPDIVDIEFISHAYLVWKDKSIELSGVCLVSYE